MKFKWTVFWFAGVLAGTLFVNLNPSIVFDTPFPSALTLAGTDWSHLFFFIVRKRLLLVFLAALSSLTFFYSPAVLLFCFCFGFITGAMTALSTAQFGLFGILYYFGTIFPQIVLYIPMWLLIMRCFGEVHKLISNRQKGLFLHAPEFVVIFVLFFGGVLLEAYVNPRLLQYLFAFM